MNNEKTVFFLLFLGNGIGVLVWTLWNRLRKKKGEGSYGLSCFIMLLLPLLGPFYYFCAWAVRRAFFKKPMSLDAIRPEKGKKEAPSKANEEKEKNMVPLEEAMAVAEKSESRVLVLDIVRRDISQSLSTILLALNSSDSEVAHYAASILQDSLGTFRENVDRMWNMILALEAEQIYWDRKRRSPFAAVVPEELLAAAAKQGGYRGKTEEGLQEEMQLARELIADMGAVLKQKVFTEPEQKAFLRQMELLMKLVAFRDRPGEEELTTVCTEETRAGMVEEAAVWSSALLQRYPASLNAWKCALRLSYAKEDYAAFRRQLEEVKHTDIELDEEMIGTIRFFSRRQNTH